MSERVIRVSGRDIATEAFGDPTQTHVLLIMGGGASMLWWPQAFCEQLATHDRYVIRYDQRETGRSTTYAPGDPPYTVDDLADDAIRVLDGYDTPAAHVVGMSLGGMIGQVAALKHPTRVVTVTTISSSPVAKENVRLPPSSDAYREHLAAGAAVNWSDRDQAITFMVEEARITAGTAHPFDEAQVSALVAQDYDRSGGYPSALHLALQSGDAWRGRLQAMQVPLLVIHGTADPVYPVEHGMTLSDAVPGAELIRLEGGGHELHRADWDAIIDAIVQHTNTT